VRRIVACNPLAFRRIPLTTRFLLQPWDMKLNFHGGAGWLR
jgi:hypothetical protein